MQPGERETQSCGSLCSTRCPICDTDAFDHQVYPMNFAPEDLNRDVFSARRLPDRLHYRMVRCEHCGLLRSNPILSAEDLARLYASSTFTYQDEAAFAGSTYRSYLERALPLVRERGRLLEIGCGSGFLLMEALGLGFREAWGVEPSVDAVNKADDSVRRSIRLGPYSEDLFPADHFDTICGFQVLDHAADPSRLVAACLRHLKPGGVAVFIAHDCGALSARLLGASSPIVDIEHTVLFDKRTVQRLFEKLGFVVHEVSSVRNTYPLRYWAKLAPVPRQVKLPLLAWLAGARIGRVAVTLRAGNLGLIASKAARDA